MTDNPIRPARLSINGRKLAAVVKIAIDIRSKEKREEIRESTRVTKAFIKANSKLIKIEEKDHRIWKKGDPISELEAEKF